MTNRPYRGRRRAGSAEPGSQRGSAFVVPRPGAAITADELRAHCRARASSYKVPDRIELRPALPVTETGKLFRRALREEAVRLAGLAPAEKSAT